MNERTEGGFTLIELMLVVAILGILAAVVLPSYQDSVLKGKRAQGRAALVELLQQEERYMTQRNCYAAFSTDATGIVHALPSCGVTPAVTFKAFSGGSFENAAYVLSAAACTDPAGVPMPLTECVQLTAAPRHPDPDAGSLVITSAGLRDCTGERKSDPRVCWP